MLKPMSPTGSADTESPLMSGVTLLARALTAITIAVSFAGCGGRNDSAALPDSAELVVPGAAAEGSMSPEATAGPLSLTAADLDGFEKGIKREIEIVREAAKRTTGGTPEERGAAIQAQFETNTIPAAAPVTGLSAERYALVRKTLSTLLTTLDFQGVIDGPQSLDTARASADMKARLASDPYQALDPAGAAAFKARLNRIVPLWVEYVNLTAVAG